MAIEAVVRNELAISIGFVRIELLGAFSKR